MFRPPLALRMLPPALTGEQQLARAVLEEAWHDWIRGRGRPWDRRCLHELLVLEGGGIWADVLALDAEAVSVAALRAQPDETRKFVVAFVCQDCGAPSSMRVAHELHRPKFCAGCRQERWPTSVHAEAMRLAQIKTSRWPEMADRRRWWT